MTVRTPYNLQQTWYSFKSTLSNVQLIILMHNGILLTDIKFSFGYDCVGWEVLKWQIVLSVLRQCLIVNSLYSRTSIKEHSWDSQIMFADLSP